MVFRSALVVSSLTFWAFAISAAPADAQIQDKSQQKCINAMNKAGAKLAKTQGKENAKCVRNGGKGTETNAQACLTADAKSKVSKAEGKTATAETKSCTTAPSFGKRPAAAVNAAAKGEEVSLVSDIFGADLTAAVISATVDKAGAVCQGAVIKSYEKLVATKVKTFLKCKKTGLKDGSITSAATLETCFDAIVSDPKGKVGKAKTKLAATFTKKCPSPAVDLDAAFPGNCVGASPFSDCVDAAAECRVCLMLDAMDGLARDCDIFDDGIANLSCAMFPSTTTTTSTTTTSTTTTSTTLTTMPPPQWGLACFASDSCGAFCGGSSCTCDAYLGSIAVPPSMAMCFFDCMDAPGTVDACRASCGGPTSAPACDTTVAGSGGFPGIVTGPGACEPSGFAASVTAGGSSAEVKRFEVSFTTAIDESTMFDAPPPACPAGCPGSGCVPTAVKPLADHVRVQIGAPPAGAEAEVCDREGVAMSACKFGPTDYVLLFDTPVCTMSPVDITLFMSCHIGDGAGTFLHFSTGDFFFTGSF